MAGAALVAGIEFAAPEVEEGEGLRGVANFVAEIIRDAAIGVDGVEVGSEALGQEPGGDVEILVVSFGEVLAPGTGFGEGGCFIGNAIGRWESRPATSEEGLLLWFSFG